MAAAPPLQERLAPSSGRIVLRSGVIPALQPVLFTQARPTRVLQQAVHPRQKGLYSEQVDRWRQAAQDANEKPVLTIKEQKELEKLRAQDQREIKAL